MDSLEEQLLSWFTARKLTLATAESCTGGLLADRLTNVSGSSEYYLGGVVSYAYSAKEALLGVDHDTLMREGAVSEAVARQMAEGARSRLSADVGIGITGVAGPGGGTPDKPVGLVWIGLADSTGSRAVKYQWDGDRLGNKQQSAQAALEMLAEWIKAAGQ
jgi:nicotinamide-nucleotide amidase